MKTIMFFSRIMGLILLLSSCRNESIDNSSWLHIDAEERIVLASDAGERVIAVSSNEGHWSASSNTPWLEVRQIGDNLIINAETNESLVVRKAQVLVTTARSSKTLQVEQAGYPTLIVETNPAEVSFSEREGEMRVILRSNATEWTVTNPASEWLEVIPRPGVGELILKVQANQSTTPRTADLEIKSAGHSYQLQVKQAGQLHLYMPHLVWGDDLEDVERVEYQRRSKLVASPNPNRKPRVPDYTFETASKAFPEVKYEFTDFGSKHLYSVTMVGDVDVALGREFHEYLERHGFRRVSASSTIIEYTGDKSNVYIYKVTDNRTKKHLGVVFFVPVYEQPEDQPTLDRLEIGINRFGAVSKEEIGQWETEHSGQYDDDFSTLIGGTFYFVPEPFYARGYFFNKPDASGIETLKYYVILYTDYKWGIYRYGGMDYLTKEFKALLDREGFSFGSYSAHSRTFRYTNKAKGLGVQIKSMAIGKYLTLRMDFFPIAPRPATANLEEQVNEMWP